MPPEDAARTAAKFASVVFIGVFKALLTVSAEESVQKLKELQEKIASDKSELERKLKVYQLEEESRIAELEAERERRLEAEKRLAAERERRIEAEREREKEMQIAEPTVKWTLQSTISNPYGAWLLD